VRRVRVAAALLAGVLLCAGAVLFVALRPPPPLPLPAQGVTLGDVTLIEPGHRHLAHRQIVVEGARIAHVAPPAAAPDAFQGAYVLPGLNDLHVHFPPSAIPGQAELWSLLLLAHGVTGVRDPGDVDGTSSLPARDGSAAGRFPAPRMLACGYFVDGDPPLWKNTLRAGDPEEGRRAAHRVAEEGFDCVKAYDRLDEPTLDAIRESAHARGLPVIGHVPKRVPFGQARLDDAQHLIGVNAVDPDGPDFPFDQESWLTIDDARIDAVIRTSLANDIAHTPTLVVQERLLALRDYPALLEEPDARRLPRFYRGVLWNPQGGIGPAARLGADDWDVLARAFEAKLRVVKRLHAAGVRLHTGSDTLVSFVVPGAGLHRELRLLVRAGLTPEAALAVSTNASAQVFGVPGLGRIAEGAPAELAIFREDPTRSLDALDTLMGVVRDGRLYTREQLDAQLARYRAHWDGALNDFVLTRLVRRALSRTAPDA
jgi:hypothetical protein